MPPRRTPISRAVTVVLLIGLAAGLGWLLGHFLPFETTPSVKTPGGESDVVSEPEASLQAQIAAVAENRSGTIHVASQPLGRRELALLGRLPNLEVLLLDHPDNQIGDDECRLLADLPKLIHLRIRGGTIGDPGLEHLPQRMPQLKILNLPHSRATDTGLASLAAMSRLIQLRLGSRHITDEGMQELARFPALRQLHLIDVPISDAGLDSLGQLPRLKSLYLDGSRVTDRGLDRLFRARPDLHVHINQQHHDRDPQRKHE